jgi:hypothetical protein
MVATTVLPWSAIFLSALITSKAARASKPEVGCDKTFASEMARSYGTTAQILTHNIPRPERLSRAMQQAQPQ